MGLFNRIGNQGQQQQQLTVQQIRQDPIGMAKQRGFDIPDNLAGNPKGMVQHLIKSGQIGGQKLQQAMQMMQRLGIK